MPRSRQHRWYAWLTCPLNPRRLRSGWQSHLWAVGGCRISAGAGCLWWPLWTHSRFRWPTHLSLSRARRAASTPPRATTTACLPLPASPFHCACNLCVHAHGHGAVHSQWKYAPCCGPYATHRYAAIYFWLLRARRGCIWGGEAGHLASLPRPLPIAVRRWRCDRSSPQR